MHSAGRGRAATLPAWMQQNSQGAAPAVMHRPLPPQPPPPPPMGCIRYRGQPPQMYPLGQPPQRMMGMGRGGFYQQQYRPQQQQYRHFRPQMPPPPPPPPMRTAAAAWTRHLYPSVFTAARLVLLVAAPRLPVARPSVAAAAAAPKAAAAPPVDRGVWERKWDLDSGLSFYENSVSGERSFDKPKGYDMREVAAAHAVARNAAATANANAALAAATAAAGAAAGGYAATATFNSLHGRVSTVSHGGGGVYNSAYPPPPQGGVAAGSASASQKRKAELPPGVHSWKEYKQQQKRKKVIAKNQWLFGQN